MKGRQDRISKASIISILDVDDRMLLADDGGDLKELETWEMDIFHHLDVSLQDLIQHQTGEISVECDVTLTKGVGEGVHFSVEHHGTCDDALPAV